MQGYGPAAVFVLLLCNNWHVGKCPLWADFDEKGFDLRAFGFRPSLSRSAFQAG